MRQSEFGSSFRLAVPLPGATPGAVLAVCINTKPKLKTHRLVCLWSGGKTSTAMFSDVTFQTWLSSSSPTAVIRG